MSKCPDSIWTSPRMETPQLLLAISSSQRLVPQTKSVSCCSQGTSCVSHCLCPLLLALSLSTTEKSLAAYSFVPSIQIICIETAEISLSLPVTGLNSPGSLSFSSWETLQTLQHHGGLLMDVVEELCCNQAVACCRYSAIPVPSLSVFFHNYFYSCFLSRNSQTWLH